jgi:hypothetical protein
MVAGTTRRAVVGTTAVDIGVNFFLHQGNPVGYLTGSWVILFLYVYVKEEYDYVGFDAKSATADLKFD